MSSFSIWFIFYHLCTNRYRTSSTIFFSPFDACFLLLIVHVHNSTTCVNHSDSSTGYYTWSKFIFSTHHSYCAFVTNWLVANDNSFILSFFSYCSLSFCRHESSLHRVFAWFLLIVCFRFFFWLCLFVFSFALYFWWMGSHPWFFL